MHTHCHAHLWPLRPTFLSPACVVQQNLPTLDVMCSMPSPSVCTGALLLLCVLTVLVWAACFGRRADSRAATTQVRHAQQPALACSTQVLDYTATGILCKGRFLLQCILCTSRAMRSTDQQICLLRFGSCSRLCSPQQRGLHAHACAQTHVACTCTHLLCAAVQRSTGF